MKKIIFIQLLLLFSIKSFAYDFEVDGIYYKILVDKLNEVEVVPLSSQVSPYTYSIIVPSTVTYEGTSYTVTAIGDFACLNCSNLTHVELPNTIQYIGKSAFGNIGASSIKIPDSCISIGVGAFSGCRKLEDVILSNNLVEINTDAFNYCIQLSSISLPNTLTTIGNSAFSQCENLQSVEMGESVQSIGDSAFQLCKKLNSISLPNSIENIGSYAFRECSSLSIVTIPTRVTNIKDNTFENCSNLTSIQISQNLTSIGRMAFYGCKSITSFTIPKSVKSIGDLAFAGNSDIETIISEIEEPFSIGEQTFYCYGHLYPMLIVPYGTKAKYEQYTNWIKFFNKIEEANPTFIVNVTSEGNGDVRYNDIVIRNNSKSFSVEETSATFCFTPDAGYHVASVKVNGTDVTSNISNNQLTITDVKENIDVDVVFRNMSVGDTFTAETVEGVLMTFKVTDSKNMICQVGNDTNPAIDVSTTGTVTIPAEVNGYKVTAIGKKAFWNTYFYVRRFILPEGIISIGNWAFYQESSLLETINIPSSVESIGDRAFANCTKLKYVYITDIKSWCNITFEGVWSNPLCYAGCLYLNDQKIANLQIPEGVTKLNSNTFIYYTDLESVTLPSSITSIGNGAFQYCKNLAKVISNINPPFSIPEDVFSNILSGSVLQVPFGTKDKYLSVTGWTSNFSQIQEIGAYTLEITVSGNGSATYSSTTIKNQTKSFTVEEGTSATISFTPDTGYRISSVLV